MDDAGLVTGFLGEFGVDGDEFERLTQLILAGDDDSLKSFAS